MLGVTAKPPLPAVPRSFSLHADGALTATIGTVAGSLLLGGAGLSLWLLPCDDSGFDCLGPAILGIFAAMAGFIIGSLLGCYIALRVRKHARAGVTVPVLIALGAVAGLASLGLGFASFPSRLLPVLAVVFWLGLPSLARWVVVVGWSKARSAWSRAAVEI